MLSQYFYVLRHKNTVTEDGRQMGEFEGVVSTPSFALCARGKTAEKSRLSRSILKDAESAAGQVTLRSKV